MLLGAYLIRGTCPITFCPWGKKNTKEIGQSHADKVRLKDDANHGGEWHCTEYCNDKPPRACGCIPPMHGLLKILAV